MWDCNGNHPQNGASERIIHGQNGLLIDSPRDLNHAFKLLEAFVDPVERFMMGQAARESAEAWTLDDNYRAVELLYRDLVSKRKLASGLSPSPRNRSAA